MNLEDTIYVSCASYSMIHPNRAAALNHLFVVLGNGYDWENGELVECCGESTTKSGKRLSPKAAINKVFRNRRKRKLATAAWERRRKRDEKKMLEHRKDCPVVTRCNCGMHKIDPKDHTKWCARNFDPKDGDVVTCDCGAAARIKAHEASMKSIDDLIEKALAEIKKRTPEENAKMKADAAKALKESRRQQRAEARWEYRIPTDIRKRVKDTKNFDNWYPVSMDYPSNLLNFPDDIKDDWLDGVIETAELIAESYGRFEREGGPAFTNYGLHHDPDGSAGKKATRATYVVANAALHRAHDLKDLRQRKKQNAARKIAHEILDGKRKPLR